MREAKAERVASKLADILVPKPVSLTPPKPVSLIPGSGGCQGPSSRAVALATRHPEPQVGKAVEAGRTAPKFDRAAYQREYMRKRRATKSA
jgi:hypothetical protein